MNLLLLYLLLLKATMTSFSGLASLPVLRSDLVIRYHVLTDAQLNTAVAAGRMGPGPVGNYVVSVGYQIGGYPGAAAGWLAMITPAFVIIVLLRFVGRRAEHPRVRGMIRAITLAGAGLLLAAAVPLAREAIHGPLPFVIASASLLLSLLTKIDSIWVVLGAALAGLLAFYL